MEDRNQKPKLTAQVLQQQARAFAEVESTYPEPSLYGVTDGKAIGTYVEHKFKAFLAGNYDFVAGSSASGIDLPKLGVDIQGDEHHTAAIVLPL